MTLWGYSSGDGCHAAAARVAGDAHTALFGSRRSWQMYAPCPMRARGASARTPWLPLLSAVDPCAHISDIGHPSRRALAPPQQQHTRALKRAHLTGQRPNRDRTSSLALLLVGGPDEQGRRGHMPLSESMAATSLMAVRGELHGHADGLERWRTTRDKPLPDTQCPNCTAALACACCANALAQQAAGEADEPPGWDLGVLCNLLPNHTKSSHQ